MNSDGSVVKTISGRLSLPDEIPISGTGTTHYTVSKTHSVSIDPGKYDFRFTCDARVSYNIDCGENLRTGGCFGFIFIPIGGMMIYTWYYLRTKKKAPSYTSQPPPYSPYAPTYGQTSYSSQSLYSAPSSPYGQSYDSSYPSGSSALEYRQGGVYAELVCNNCGQIVRSPPVSGVVTCEHCGDKARIY